MGKTALLLQQGGVKWKHPHGHGEDDLSRPYFSFGKETPPRAWGRQRGRSSRGYGGRNTPTGMGKTALLLQQGGVKWKHPHGHGEDRRARRAAFA